MKPSIAQRPIVLGPVELADRLATEPSLLGEWTRRLFGEELPLFTKLLRAHSPPFVHVGFRRAVDRHALLGWLAREQASLRQLLGMLDVPSRAAFDQFMHVYSTWATTQAGERWLRVDQEELAGRLAPFVRPEAAGKLVATLTQLRHNRAQIVDVLNEVDLRREAGNLLLTPAGVVHAISGFPLQTHALDRTRSTLEALLRNLRRLAAAGADDATLRALADEADLPALRRANRAAAKNEAWLPGTIGGQLLLVEPLESSDTTYTLADFYTPFVWDRDRIRFRKGEPAFGLASSELAQKLDDVDLSPTSIDRIRRVPTRIPSLSTRDALLFRLVDEPTTWPFFTAHQLELSGRPGAAARWRGDHAPGVFPQLVVLDGEVDLVGAHGHGASLDLAAPALIPATLTGGYQLVTFGAARVLILSVPGPRGGFPDA